MENADSEPFRAVFELESTPLSHVRSICGSHLDDIQPRTLEPCKIIQKKSDVKENRLDG